MEEESAIVFVHSAGGERNLSEEDNHLWYTLSLNNTDTNLHFHQMPAWRISLWSLFFGSMVVASLLGNIIVICIVFSDKKMRTVTNYFLVNLAVSDILLSTLNTVFSFAYMVTYNWFFADALCAITQYVAVFSVACSSFTLIAISAERYRAIAHPLRKRMSKSSTLICISMVWTISISIALPHALYASVDESDLPGKYICQLVWPDGPTFQSFHEFIYNVIFTLATYFVPITLTGGLYTRVGWKLWKSQVIGEATSQQIDIIKSKRKIVRMLIIVVVIFAACWLPYHTYFLVSWLHPSINTWPHIQEVYLAVYWLAMSSSMYNPFIYCWMNGNFRQGFKQKLCCIAKRKKARSSVQVISK